jgi:hypothetical protein
VVNANLLCQRRVRAAGETFGGRLPSSLFGIDGRHPTGFVCHAAVGCGAKSYTAAKESRAGNVNYVAG